MVGFQLARSLRMRNVPPIELTVEAGQVVCPRRGVIDIEDCFHCSSYRGMTTGPVESLVCTPTSSSALSLITFGTVPR